MKDGDDAIATIIVLSILIYLIAAFPVGYLMGISKGETNIRKQAITNGFGSMVITNQFTGETVFVWKEKE